MVIFRYLFSKIFQAEALFWTDIDYENEERIH